MGGMQFSNRTGSQQLNPIALSQAKALNRGDGIRSLNDSNPTRHGLGLPSLGVYAAEPRGPLSARRALTTFLCQRGQAVSSEHLYLLNSTSQAYSWLLKLLCNPSDIVLEPRPGYPLIESIARLESVLTMPYVMHYDGSWFLDIAHIRSLLEGPQGNRIRAIILINPNNPTGSYIHPQERARLIELCCKHGIAIIADEVFFDYPLEPIPGRQRFAGESAVLTFALDGLSKMLAAPQVKLGWIHVSGPDQEVEEAEHRLDMIADDYLPLSQIIADQIPDLLQLVHHQSTIVRNRCIENLQVLRTLLEEPGCPVSLLKAEGGWNVLLRFPAVIDENELITYLIDHYGYTGQPGYFFDMASNGYLALSLLPAPEEFVRGVRAILCSVEAILAL